MPPLTFQQSLDEVAALVKHFHTNRAAFLKTDYKEAHARQELIDPLFIALGWDVHNAGRAAPDYREVILEDTLDIEGQKKAPDYAFKVGRERKFFAEAKKPGVDIKGDATPAYQLRRYAWSAKLPLSLLTDFEELAVYDCRQRPAPKDKAAVGRLNFYTFDSYPDHWRAIWDVFSREAVWAGSFDQFAQTARGKRGASEVDAEFLKEIEGWREALARNIALRNPRLTIDDLNDTVQRVIDRIIFLRMAEDRGVEEYGRLQRLVEGANDIYAGLMALSRQADAKYNSGLFDFSKAGDTVTPSLAVDDKTLKPILAGLYFPQSPYEFSVLPVEILGNVYEQFLGKVIRLTASHQAKVEEKPEVKKAGGVYYTPAYIVEYIVRNTVGKLAEGKGPQELKDFRVLDPACGSGSFLLGAYQCLLDHYLKWYTANDPEKWAAKKNPPLRELPNPNGQLPTWHLTTAEKKRLLTSHIFGVDIDRQAVEVTKLSLLLKVLEGESDETLGRQLALLQERVLPNLDRNIKCGNSLIGPDYFAGQLVAADPDELRRVNPFDWEREFPEAMRAGGFDTVIGNPPYIRVGNIEETIRPYLYQKYDITHRFDIYIVFIQKALTLLLQSGELGFIVPNKFFASDYGVSLRANLASKKALTQVVDFGDSQVFQRASTYTCLLFLSRTPHDKFDYLTAQAKKTSMMLDAASAIKVATDRLGAAPWTFLDVTASGLFDRLKTLQQLGVFCDIERGLETGFDDLFFLFTEGAPSPQSHITVTSGVESKPFQIEKTIIRRLVKGSVDIRRYLIEDSNRYLLFPYEHNGDDAQLIDEKIVRVQYPMAWRYLASHASELKARKGKLWYAFRRRNYDLRDGVSRLLIPSIAQRLSAACDIDGQYHFVGSGGGGGGGYGIVLKSETAFSIYYLLGILNCRLLDWLVKRVNSRFSGDYYSFNKQYIEPLPIRRINFSDPSDKARHDRLVALVESMLELHKRLNVAKSQADRELYQRQIDATDKQIDSLVYELYGLTEEEIGIVEGR